MQDGKDFSKTLPVTVNPLRQLAYRLSRSDILFWTLPFLMLLLVIGTIAQKDLGIYAAQRAYFSSFITFIGPVPFPGGATLMIVLFINMLMKFLLFSEWQWHKAGSILTHFGVLLLLIGGFVTAATTKESYIVIEEGSSSRTLEDYYQRILSISKDGERIHTIPHQKLEKGMTIKDASFPFSFTIDTYCFNCGIERRKENDGGWQWPGQFMQLIPARALPQNEENLTGIEFTIQGTNEDGHYVTFDKFPKPPLFTVDGHEYKIEIARAAKELPFTIKLDKFTVGFYPGTSEAKSYRSDVEIIDGTNTWKSTIEMNEPLRYRGFTIYQSSFDMSGERPFTVLNVVENSGRIFPYIATLIIGAGLILHLLIRLIKRRHP